VTELVVQRAVDVARSLPHQDVRRLAAAAAGGAPALRALRDQAAGARLRDACASLLSLQPFPGDLVAGVLLGSVETQVRERKQSIDVVWTGPESDIGSRLTSAVVVDLISQARSDILLVGYAVHTEPAVAAQLAKAADRGVTITLLLERQDDNAKFSGTGAAFPGLPAIRLAWPGDRRDPGASLHAKVLVVDGAAALIGSANVTGAAFERNLECGLLIRGGRHPAAVRAHILSLLQRGLLERLPGSSSSP
jgi:cardiolipin synthase